MANRYLIKSTKELPARKTKRLFDLAASTSALIVLSPLCAVVAYKVRRNLGTPVLFWQLRPGLHGKPFKMVKFRSMTYATDAAGTLLPNAERLTPFGQWLRSSSLDELPELWNVVKGEMSLVGPRPLLMEYLPRYSTAQARRHLARPGITGLAQVNGRNGISWEEKFALDIWYVDHQSLWLDIKILYKTVAQVVAKKNINARSGTLMPEFGSHLCEVNDSKHSASDNNSPEDSRVKNSASKNSHDDLEVNNKHATVENSYDSSQC
jgi:lipopolysaccharide/colanic/teichoic acid biosynthesis glycosyltransferase